MESSSLVRCGILLGFLRTGQEVVSFNAKERTERTLQREFEKLIGREGQSQAASGQSLGSALSVVAIDACTGYVAGAWSLECLDNSYSCDILRYNLFPLRYSEFGPPQVGLGDVLEPLADGSERIAFHIMNWVNGPSHVPLPWRNINPNEYPWKPANQPSSFRQPLVTSQPSLGPINPTPSPQPPVPKFSHRCGGKYPYEPCSQTVQFASISVQATGNGCPESPMFQSPAFSEPSTGLETPSAPFQVCFASNWAATVPPAGTVVQAVSKEFVGNEEGAVLVSGTGDALSFDDDIGEVPGEGVAGLPTCLTMLLNAKNGEVIWNDTAACVSITNSSKSIGFGLSSQLTRAWLIPRAHLAKNSGNPWIPSLLVQFYETYPSNPFAAGDTIIGFVARDTASGHALFNDIVFQARAIEGVGNAYLQSNIIGSSCNLKQSAEGHSEWSTCISIIYS